MPPAAYIARGTLRTGSSVSPTWHAAASNAGAAKPMRYRPAIALVTAPKTPGNGDCKCIEGAACQSTLPLQTGMSTDAKASAAEADAMATAKRVTSLMPYRFSTVKASTMTVAATGIGSCGRYHEWIAVADKIAVNPHVGTQPHQ